MKKALLVMLAILLVGAGGYLYGKSNTVISKSYTPNEDETEEAFIQTEVGITAEVIQEGMNDIGQLVTQEYTYTEEK